MTAISIATHLTAALSQISSQSLTYRRLTQRVSLLPSSLFRERGAFGQRMSGSAAEYASPSATACETKGFSEVDPANFGVGFEFLWGARAEDFAVVDDVGTVGDAQCFADVVIGH